MEVYENAMVEARVAFAGRVDKLVQMATPEKLGFFLIYYSALGAKLHESLEKLMKKAAKRCKKLGFADLNTVFSAQAEFEDTHSHHLKNDTKNWIAWWNEKKSIGLSPREYLHHPAMPSMQNFFDLHLDVVEHQSLFAEIAMAYEIQRANMIYSFSLIKLAIFKLGLSALRPLNFIRRTNKENASSPLTKTVLFSFLKEHADGLPIMIDKANATLSIYADFLEDCFKLAENEAKKYQLLEPVGMK